MRRSFTLHGILQLDYIISNVLFGGGIMIPHMQALSQPFTLNNETANSLAINQYYYSNGVYGIAEFTTMTDILFNLLWEKAHGNDFDHDVHREPWNPYVPLIPVEQWGC